MSISSGFSQTGHNIGGYSKPMEDNRSYSEEQEKSEQSSQETGKSSIVIPVVHEHVVINKEIVETGKVRVRKTVKEEEATVNLPIIQESYNIERVPVNKVFETPPPALRYEGDTIIIPVLREVVVVQKHYEVIEEVHLTKRTTETPFMQQITLRKENVTVDRIENGGEDTNSTK